MEYYGNNDYRDYLAHYGKKGMKWKKRKKRLLLPDAGVYDKKLLRKRKSLDGLVGSKKDKNALDELRGDAKSVSAAPAPASGGGSRLTNSHKSVVSSVMVQANETNMDPGAGKSGKKKKGKGKVKALKNTKATVRGSTIRSSLLRLGLNGRSFSKY